MSGLFLGANNEASSAVMKVRMTAKIKGSGVIRSNKYKKKEVIREITVRFGGASLLCAPDPVETSEGELIGCNES